MATELAAKASLRTEDFSAGVKQIRERLTELNTALEKNKQELSENNKEAKKLRQAQEHLAKRMKKTGGGTDAQKQKLQELGDRLAQTTAKIGSLRAQQVELKSSIRDATKELEEQKNASDGATGKLNAQATATKEVSAASDTAKTSVLNLGTAIKALIASAAAKTLWTSLIGSNAEMEQTLTSFTVMLGDAEKAKALVEEMTEFAASTPLELPDVTAASQMLMNYGVAADEVIEKITRLGDLSGGNAAKLDRVSLAYGQMLAKGKVTGEELRQMTEAGVPLLQALADTLGKTTAEVQDMVSKSKVGIDDLDRAIESLTTGSGQFSGMMEKQSQTLTGMLSTTRDLISKFERDVGEEAFAEAKDALSDLLETIRKLEEDGTLAEWAKTVGGGIADVLRWAKEAVSAILSEGEPIAELTKFVIENKEAVLAGIAAYKGFTAANNAINSVTNAVVGFANAHGIAVDAVQILKAALTDLNYFLNSFQGGVLIVSAVIAGYVAYINELDKASERAAEKVQKLTESAKELNEEAESGRESAKSLQGLAEQYKEITQSEDTDAEKKERLSEIQRDLNELYEQEAKQIDLVNGKYEENIEKIEELSETKLAYLRAKALEAVESTEEAVKTAQSILANGMSQYNNSSAWVFDFEVNEDKTITEGTRAMREILENIAGEYGIGDIITGLDGDGRGTITLNFDDSAIENLDLQAQADFIQEILDKMRELGLETEFYDNYAALYELWESKSNVIQANIDAQEEYNKLCGDTSESLLDEKKAEEAAAQAAIDRAAASVQANTQTAHSLEEIEKAAQDCRKATGELAKETKSLSSAFAEQNEDGSLSVDTVLSLVDAGYAAALAVDAETGAVRLDTEAYKELAKAKIEAQKADLLEQRAQATQENIEKMKLASGSGDHKRIAELQKANKSIVVEYDVQIAALDSIDLDKVTSGTYGEKKQSGSSGSGSSSGSKSAVKDVSGIQSEMKSLSEAFKEQNESGEISIETANKLISLGYAQAVVTDKVTGKITLQGEEVKKLYNEKVEAAKNSEDATQAEIDLLDLLSGKYGEVEEGVYGVKKANEESAKTVSELESEMKTLSEAFAEQNENGTLSLSTIQKMIDLGYEEALEIDETTGKVTLKKEAVESLLGAQTDETAAALEAERAEQEAAGKTVQGTNAKISVLKQLKKQLSEVTDGTYGVQTDYSDINKAFKEAADERIKAIDDELSAKKKASEEAIAAIDAEIKARKRAKEDDDVQSEIDAVNAQLQYAQLDDFSRFQLERKLQGLQEQQADTAWERGTEDRKAAINAQYDLDEEKAAEEKERIKSGSEAVDQALKKAADGIELSAEEIGAAVLAIQDVLKGFTGGAITQQAGTQLYQSTTDGRTFNTNVNFASQGLTADQIVRMIVDALMSEPIL